MNRISTAALVLTISAWASAPLRADNSAWQKELNAYNITWTTQSNASKDSMPLAGGILGLNVWVENGEVCFLIGSPNCLDENGMQVKLGLVRLHFSPDVFGSDFRQELRLSQSEVVITGKTLSGAPVSVKLWCGVDKPVVHVETAAGEAIEVAATYETWSNYNAKVSGDGLQWSRRLAEVNARRQRDMQAQGVAEFADKIPDPLSGLTEGGQMIAPGMVDAGSGTSTFNGMVTKTCALKTAAPVKQLDLCIALRMEQDKSLADWEAQLDMDAGHAVQNAAADRATALSWWAEFWNRSHISINPGAPETDEGWLAGRNYQLARYQLAGNRNGRAMTLFNGGLFPCEGNPDHRMWDGCQFMAQNQRLMAWAELKTGDDDLLKVSLDFYRDRADIRRLHAKKFWGVDGLVFPEAFSIFGLDSIGTNADGRSIPGHLHYHYTASMEFALLMLEYGRFTGQDIGDYLPAAEGVISYYDQYFQKVYSKKTGHPLDEDGRLVIYPSDALEMFHLCTNDVTTVCGLEALTQALLGLPENYLTPDQRAYYKSFQRRIPPITLTETADGKKYVAPAKDYDAGSTFFNGNMEFPNMYICFPFDHFFLGRKDNGIELASNTWDYGAIRPAVQKQAQCWYQTAINLARLGRTAEAKHYTVQKLVKNPSLRFPSFWTNYGFCHAPDTDHAAAAMIGMQEMIMQTDGRRILLGPAWPGEWNCDFKLHAPYQTTVEGHVARGRVVVDKVTPESRRGDIEIYPLKMPPAPPVSEGKPATASTTYGGGYTPDKAFDGDPQTRWSASIGQASAWLAVDLGAPASVGRAVIDESSYPQTTKFAIEAQTEDGTWRAVADGGTIGAHKELKFTPVKARRFRLNIIESKLINAQAGVTINEFQLFDK